jgi:hypothetical protein
MDANQLIPDDRLSFYGLLERVSDYSQDDPVHNNVDLFSVSTSPNTCSNFQLRPLRFCIATSARRSSFCFAG